MQDDEYLASLQADREKELKAIEEAEAHREEERQKEEESRRKFEEQQVQLQVLLPEYVKLVYKNIIHVGSSFACN